MDRVILNVNSKVKFRIANNIKTGIINKIFMPGSSGKYGMEGDNKVRYSLVDSNDNNHTYIIEESQLVAPDFQKMCDDPNYRYKLEHRKI